jgi:hypothetical protein
MADSDFKLSEIIQKFELTLNIVYGAVTIGTIWQFLKLENKTVIIERRWTQISADNFVLH